MRGIRDIRITGIIFSDSILIGANTELGSIMTRIFMISTIGARGEVGIKVSMAFVPLELLVLAFVLEHPPLVFIALEPPVLVFAILKPLDLFILPEPLLLVFAPLG
jgi:hypothetical protein